MTASWIQGPSLRMAFALIPGAVLLAMRFVIAADEDLWNFFRVTDAAVLVAAVVVTAINFRIDRHMTLWSLPALGVGIPALLSCLNSVLWALLPQPLLYPPPALYTIGTKAINVVGLLTGTGMLILSLKLARQLGAPAALGLLILIGFFSLEIVDPAYGMLGPHSELTLQAASVDLLVLLPYVILLPLWVLSSYEHQGRLVMYLLPGAAYLLALLIRVIYVLPLYEGIRDAPSVAEMRLYALRVWPQFEGIAWLVQAGLVFLCSRVRRPSPPAVLNVSPAAGTST